MATNVLINRCLWRLSSFEGAFTFEQLPALGTWQHQFIILLIQHHYVLIYQDKNKLVCWDPLIKNPVSKLLIEIPLRRVAQDHGLKLVYRYLNWQSFFEPACAYHCMAKLLALINGRGSGQQKPFQFQSNVKQSFADIRRYLRAQQMP